MKPKTIILMVVAIGCGLAASYMTSRLLADRANKEQPEAKVKVLVAIKRIPAFEPIKKPEDYFVEKEVPEGTYPSKCLRSFDDVRGQRLAKAKQEEETVFKEDILTKDQAGIYANLQQGQRAIAIRVNPEVLAGGFVLPGSRVDFISTYSGANGELQAETIMQNVLILAVDQQTNRDDKQAMLASTVTVALKVEEGQRLALAARQTDIRLVLRSPDDKEKFTLPPSKMFDWRKPLLDGGGVEGSGVEGDSSPGATALTKLNGVKKPDTEVLTVAPKIDLDQTVAVEPTPTPGPPPVTHTLTIISGEYETKAIYIKKENGEWARGTAEQLDDGASHPKSGGSTPPVPQPVKVFQPDDKTK
jgi:Flp pilus assembly protein CpaB